MPDASVHARLAHLDFLKGVRSWKIWLGLGIQDGASWGLLIAGASQDLVNGIWGPLVGTVTAMFLLIYSLSTIGDALRDVLDPRVG